MERREFLLAMGRVRGRVEVEDQPLGALWVADEVRLEDRPRHQVACLGARLVLEPAQRWLAGEVVVGEGVTATARLEDRIATQRGRVITVLVAERDPVDALLK